MTLLLNFVFDNNFFSYKGNYYRQTFGCAMGSKLSPILAQYITDDLLDTCIPSLSFEIPFIKKFVDDLITSIPADKVEEILMVFNNYDANLKFTIEREDENKSVPYLDTRVIRDQEGNIVLDWYQKQSASGRYLNYHSIHSLGIKKNLIKQMKKRITNISDNQFLNKNLRKLELDLIKNGYPKQLVNSLLFRTDAEMGERSLGQNNAGVKPAREKFATMINIPNLTNRIINIFQKENLMIAKKNEKTVGGLYTKLKDKVSITTKSNVVYKLQCKDCDKIYIGQTSQHLKNRISGHKSDCEHNKDRCMLAVHVNDNKHVINYDEVKIVATEANYTKRLFLEMFYIKTTENTMNKRSDVQNLSNIYTYIMSKANSGRNNNLTLYEEAITF